MRCSHVQARDAAAVCGEGLEIAEGLIEREISVHLIDRSAHVMRTMDAEMAERLEQIMTDVGIRLHLGETLTELEADDDRCRAVVTDAGRYEVDLREIRVVKEDVTFRAPRIPLRYAS